MTVIEIPDEQAEALKARAAAEGLTLEAWLKRLAEERPVPGSPSVLAAAARIRELQKHAKPDPEGWTIRDYINYGRR
jgi:plasmid stability protein